MVKKTQRFKMKNVFKKTTKFFREMKSELKKVAWLNKQQLLNSMIAVVFICLMFGIVIWVLDFGLSMVLDYTLR